MIDRRPPRHASRRSPIVTVALPIGIAVTALGMLWSITEPAPFESAALPPAPLTAVELPAIDSAESIAADPCSDPAVTAALAAGDDEAAIAGFGGGTAFRDAVVAGNAPCISLVDPSHVWVIVNKIQPLDPIDYAPQPLVEPRIRTTTAADLLGVDAAEALSAMADALRASGAGDLGMNSGYRSYEQQVRTYGGYVASSGQEAADTFSARPGHSEHQTGLTLDVVPCGGGCGSIDDFGASAEGAWVAEHAWEHGFIVRYEEGETGVTGYVPEAWHLRYIGPQLAAAYHAGGFHSLEEFFGLPASPEYVH